MPNAADADGTPPPARGVPPGPLSQLSDMKMVVAVQHEFGAVRGNDAQEFPRRRSAACGVWPG